MVVAVFAGRLPSTERQPVIQLVTKLNTAVNAVLHCYDSIWLLSVCVAVACDPANDTDCSECHDYRIIELCRVLELLECVTIND